MNAQSLLKGSATAATPGDWAILSPIPGWQKTSPIMSTLVTGRDDELDEDYRIRIRTSDGSGGKRNYTSCTYCFRKYSLV